MDTFLIEVIVRTTVRISALAFVVALICFAVAGTHGRQWMSSAVRALAAFIVVHTLHFAAVVWLAVATDGRNIEARGGWALMITIAVLFYASAFGIVRAWRSVAAGHLPTGPSSFASGFGVLFIAAVFLNSYIARVERMPVYWLPASVMVASVGFYFLQTHRFAAHITRSRDRSVHRIREKQTTHFS
jgi:hypothetical protein